MSKTFTLLTALLTGSTVFAQKDTIKTNVLDEVVVTANKTEQKQSTTGKVITVISKEQIEKSAGKTVAQLLNEQAGIVVNGALNDPGSVQTVYMRGAAAGRTLILMDGIPVNDPSEINNDFDLNFLSINDVERIEICKGAQSTLYGSDAVAGVINIITTKSNITRAVNVKATQTAGSYGSYKTNLQVFGKADGFTYNARYSRLQSNGFSSAYDSTGKQNFDRDGYLGNIANAALQYQAGKQLVLKAFSQYSEYTAGIDAGPFTDAINDNIHNKNFTTGTGFVYKAAKFSLTGNYQYSNQHRDYNDNASTGAPIFSLNNYASISQFAELYTSIVLGGGFTLLGGADYQYGSMNNQYRSVSAYGPYNSNFNDTSMNQQSLYTSLHYTKGSFSTELGGRLTNHSKYGTHYTYTVNPSYSINAHYRIFGSIASAFKAPTLYQLYSGSGNTSLKPEASVNYEAGLQHTDQKLSNQIVFFYRQTNNGIDFNYNTYTYFNYVKQATKGIEYELSFRPADHLTLTGNYTYIAAQETTESRVSFKDTTYHYSLRRPAHNINLTAGYQFTNSFYVSISGKYVSSRYDVGAYEQPDVLLNSYCLLGAYTEYVFSNNIKIFANAQNITNTKFFDVRGYNGIPAMFNAGVSVNW